MGKYVFQWRYASGIARGEAGDVIECDDAFAAQLNAARPRARKEGGAREGRDHLSAEVARGGGGVEGSLEVLPRDQRPLEAVVQRREPRERPAAQQHAARRGRRATGLKRAAVCTSEHLGLAEQLGGGS